MLKKNINNIIKEEEKNELFVLKKFKRKKKNKKYKNFKKRVIYLLLIILLLLIIFSLITFIFPKFFYKGKNVIISLINKKNKNERIKNIIFPEFKNISYDEAGEMMFYKNNFLSFNILHEYYYGFKEDNSKFNHIHILFAFDNSYYLLASVTITSILKTANPNSYIHFHIIASKGFKFNIMKKLNSLKTKINNNTEFIFYNGTKAEEDFGSHIIYETYAAGEYAKLLGAELIDSNIDRVIALDSGDILVQKDLLELYNYPFDDYLVRGVEDPFAPCATGFDYFYKKEGYINAGVVFYNLKKWREMNIYQDIIKFYKFFNFKGKLPTPHQDILNCFLPSTSIGLLPLKYNHGEYINLNKSENEQEDPKIYKQQCSFFYGKKDIVFEAEKNVVIRHYNKHKIYKGEWNSLMTKEWQNYAKMTGFYDDICFKYPLGCK